jgi:DNA replication initiation complex subunit (GINS family)
MNYEDLRRIQHTERKAASLAEMDANFYNDLAAMITSQQEKRLRSGSQDDGKALDNTVKVARDIFEHREQKLLLKSLRTVRTGDSAGGAASLPMQEAKLLADLEAVLRQNRADFEELLVGRAPKPELVAAQKIDDIPAINGISAEEKAKKEEDLNSVLVRIIKKVPRFVSSDMREYGPFEVNDITRLPPKEAELLFSRSFIEKM